MENTKIKLVNEDGSLVEYKILFTFECEELGKNYIAYETGRSNTGEQIISVASYDPKTDLSKLEPVTDEEELKMVDDVINQIIEG